MEIREINKWDAMSLLVDNRMLELYLKDEIDNNVEWKII